MKIAFDTENKAKNDYDYPKLYLDFNERARIVCFEKEPEMDWVHNLRAPTIINGEVQMESVKGKDGGSFEKPKMDFVGKHLCFGQPNILMKGDKDPESCPTCAAANQYDYIGPATRRYSMHVVQYRIQPGGFTLQNPFQCELKAWTFSSKIFNTLVDVGVEHGDLRSKDLLLGPCENKNFQKFDIQVGGEAKWLANEETKKLVATLYTENKSDDLTPLIGRRVSKEMAQEDIDKVMLKHNQAFGGMSTPNDTGASQAAKGLDLDAMLSSSASETPTAAPVASNPTPDASTPAADPWTPDPATAASPAEVPAAADVPATSPAPSAPASADPLDFDELLKGL